MRKRLTCLISLLALAGCAKANAATVDPNNDFDCAVTSGYFREVSKLLPNVPDDQRRALFVTHEWYTEKWSHDHPGEAGKQRVHEVAMVTAMGKDHQAFLDGLDALKICSKRAAADPKFTRFADLVSEKMPDAR